MKHVLKYERTGNAVSWDGLADVYLCSCGKRWEAKSGSPEPAGCPKPKSN